MYFYCVYIKFYFSNGNIIKKNHLESFEAVLTLTIGKFLFFIVEDSKWYP